MTAFIHEAEAIAYLKLAAEDDADLARARQSLSEAERLAHFIRHGLASAHVTCARGLLARVEGRPVEEIEALLCQARAEYLAEGHDSGVFLVERRLQALGVKGSCD